MPKLLNIAKDIGWHALKDLPSYPQPYIAGILSRPANLHFRNDTRFIKLFSLFQYLVAHRELSWLHVSQPELHIISIATLPSSSALAPWPPKKRGPRGPSLPGHKTLNLSFRKLNYEAYWHCICPSDSECPFLTHNILKKLSLCHSMRNFIWLDFRTPFTFQTCSVVKQKKVGFRLR